MNNSTNSRPKTYLVTGATGTVGGYIVDELIKKGHRVRALTRTPDHANFPDEVEVATGDVSKPETVAPAFDRVTGMHLITIKGDGFGPLGTAPELIRLAEEAGVKWVTVLWNGIPGPVEDAVKASNLQWTILQPQEFMSNALEWKESIRDEGVAREVFRDRKTAYIHPADIASVTVATLTENGHHGKEVVLTGPEVLTPKRAVQIIAEVLGREIRFEERTEDEERQRMKEEYGLEKEMIDYVISWTKNPPEEGYTISPLVEKITGRPARTFREWAEENMQHFDEVKH